ncbi:MAG: DUF445 family protein [Pseudomonadota bacterium]
MKATATGLLLLMAAVFTATFFVPGEPAWLGYLRAFCEAAMVGALADWFAVTALFRHPLGLPIPHTAIIPTRKDQIGESLARFVRENFMVRSALEPRLQQIDFAARTGKWLQQPDNARRIARDAGAVVTWILAAADDDALREFVRSHLHRGVSELKVTPLLGRLLTLVFNADQHQHLMDLLVRVCTEQLQRNKVRIRLKIEQESPWWMPRFVDREIYDKIVGEIESLLRRVGTDMDHRARQAFNLEVQRLIIALKTDPELIANGEKVKEDILAEPVVQAWLGEVWSRMSGFVVEQTKDPASGLSERMVAGAINLGEALERDDAIRSQVNGWISDVLYYTVRNYGEELAAVISETVRAWDAEETSRRVELQVGRDLQFIRINGTLVGGVAGLAIYSLVHWLR